MLDVALIASATVQVLAPILRRLLSAGAEKAAEAAGEGVAETLWEKVKGKIFGKKGAVDAAAEVAAAPGDKDAQKMLWIHLEQILAADPDLAAEVEKLLQNAGAFHQEAHLQDGGVIVLAGPEGRAVAAGKGGIAIGGDVQGGVRLGRDETNISESSDLALSRGTEALGPLRRGEEATRRVEGTVYPVWFGTNRKPNARGGFTGERGDRVSQGRADVFVPKSHRFGETGSSFWKRLLRRTDDRLRLDRLALLDRDGFFAEIRNAMDAARASGEAPHALFYLHGYRNSFEDAAIRAAQIGFDLKVPGATAFFSWPSRGSVGAYTADEASIEASERDITDFLVDFAAQCGAEKVHVIAHSMGNRGLLRALQRIGAEAESRGRVKLAQIFLAAPDVDRDLFLDLARLYPEHAERTTLYASQRDLAVHLSSKFHDAPRAGYFEPYTVAPGIDTIAVPDFDVDLLGHSYFATAEALLYDIRSLMLEGKPPGRRQRLDPDFTDGASFWRFQR